MKYVPTHYQCNLWDIYMFAKKNMLLLFQAQKVAACREEQILGIINIGSFFFFIIFIFVCLEKPWREKPVCKLIHWSLKGLPQYSWVSDKQIIQLCLWTAGITAGWTR